MITDLHCDVCGRYLAGSAILTDGPQAATRLFIHPGDPLLREDGVLLCQGCWKQLSASMGEPGRAGVCGMCETEVTYEGSLHILEMTGRIGEATEWQICKPHAVEILNGFRFTDPKFTTETLALKADFTAG